MKGYSMTHKHYTIKGRKTPNRNMTEVITNDGGHIVLISYWTPVACCEVDHKGGRSNFRISERAYNYSVSTSRHVNAWLDDHGVEVPRKAPTITLEELKALVH